MRSRIDWNEVVPKLDAGLRQTLYLAAVDMLSKATGSTSEEKKREYNRKYYYANQKYYRDYAAEHKQRRKIKYPKKRRPFRRFTDSDFQKMAAYRKEHTYRATKEHFNLGTSTMQKVNQMSKG